MLTHQELFTATQGVKVVGVVLSVDVFAERVLAVADDFVPLHNGRLLFEWHFEPVRVREYGGRDLL